MSRPLIWLTDLLHPLVWVLLAMLGFWWLGASLAGDTQTLLESDLQELQQDGMPCTSCPAGTGLLTAIVEAGLTKSAGEARKLIQANGIKLNGESISDVGRDLTFEDALFERFYLLRKGKKNYHLIARGR